MQLVCHVHAFLLCIFLIWVSISAQSVFLLTSFVIYRPFLARCMHWLTLTQQWVYHPKHAYPCTCMMCCNYYCYSFQDNVMLCDDTSIVCYFTEAIARSNYTSWNYATLVRTRQASALCIYHVSMLLLWNWNESIHFVWNLVATVKNIPLWLIDQISLATYQESLS